VNSGRSWIPKYVARAYDVFLVAIMTWKCRGREVGCVCLGMTLRAALGGNSKGGLYTRNFVRVKCKACGEVRFEIRDYRIY
jgi:hypothetical protein